MTHESDYTPGLANKINAKFADKICVTFEDTLAHVGAKGVHTGTPIRPELYQGDKERGLAFLGFDDKKPVLLIMGGSLGASVVNDAVRAALPKLLISYDIVHLCGKGKVEERLNQPGYRQFEYLQGELPDAFACADMVLSRAGSNSLSEILALGKPALLVPYPATASRGDQILNAQSLAARGLAHVIAQEDLNAESLVRELSALWADRAALTKAMRALPDADGTAQVLAQIERFARPSTEG